MKKILIILISLFLLIITILGAKATDFELSWQGAITNSSGQYLDLPFNVSILIWDPVNLYIISSQTIDGRIFFNDTSGFDTTLENLNLTYNKEYELNTSVNGSAFDTYTFRSPTGWITGDVVYNGTINEYHINTSNWSYYTMINIDTLIEGNLSLAYQNDTYQHTDIFSAITGNLSLAYANDSSTYDDAWINDTFDTLITNNMSTVYNISSTDALYVNVNGDNMTGNLNNTQNITADEFIDPDMYHSGNYRTYTDAWNLFTSAGAIAGSNITVNDDLTVNMSSGSGVIRVADDDISPVKFFSWNANETIEISTDDTIYIGVEYNGGNPRIIAKSSDDWNYDTEFPLGKAVNLKDNVFPLNLPWKTGDSQTDILEWLYAYGPIIDNRVRGMVVGYTGTRNPTLTASNIMYGNIEIPIDAKDCSAGDDFFEFYRDGDTSYNVNLARTAWNVTHYDDGSGTLQEMNNNYYANYYVWVWLDATNHGYLMFIFPQNQYANLGNALSEVPPSFPSEWYGLGILRARITFKKGVDVPESVIQYEDNTPMSYAIAAHNNIANLQWDVSGHTGDVDTLAGFDSSGDASYYTESDYLLANGSRMITGNLDAGDYTIYNVTINGSLNGDWNGSSQFYTKDTTDTLINENMSLKLNVTGGYFTGSLFPEPTLSLYLGSGENRLLGIFTQNVSAEEIDTYNLRADYNITAGEYFIGSGAYLTDLNITGDLTGYALNISLLYGATGIGGMDLRGDPWYLGGVDLELSDDIIIGGGLCFGSSCITNWNEVNQSWYYPNATADSLITGNATATLSTAYANDTYGHDTIASAMIGNLSLAYANDSSGGFTNNSDISVNYLNVSTINLSSLTITAWSDVNQSWYYPNATADTLITGNATSTLSTAYVNDTYEHTTLRAEIDSNASQFYPNATVDALITGNNSNINNSNYVNFSMLTIGSAIPSEILTVESASSSGTDVRINNSYSSGWASVYVWNADGHHGGMIIGGSAIGGTTYEAFDDRIMFGTGTTTPGVSIAARNPTGDIRFYTGGVSDAERRMVITSSGNIGIGTLDPITTLEVNGNITVGNKINTSNNELILESAGNITIILGAS